LDLAAVWVQGEGVAYGVCVGRLPCCPRTHFLRHCPPGTGASSWGNSFGRLNRACRPLTSEDPMGF